MYRRATPTRNTVADAEGDLLNGGSSEIWTGAQTGSVGGSEAGNTLLGTLVFNATAFGVPSNGVVTAASITADTNADATGTAGHAVHKTSGAAVHSDASCGQGSGDYNFDNSSIVAGGTIAAASAQLTAPI